MPMRSAPCKGDQALNLLTTNGSECPAGSPVAMCKMDPCQVRWLVLKTGTAGQVLTASTTVMLASYSSPCLHLRCAFPCLRRICSESVRMHCTALNLLSDNVHHVQVQLLVPTRRTRPAPPPQAPSASATTAASSGSGWRSSWVPARRPGWTQPLGAWSPAAPPKDLHTAQ